MGSSKLRFVVWDWNSPSYDADCTALSHNYITKGNGFQTEFFDDGRTQDLGAYEKVGV